MAELEAGKIVCSGCERRYTWRAELAGKRVKCKCGGQVDVPKAPPGAAAPAVAVAAAHPAPIAYQSAAPSREDTRFSFDNLVEKKRDIYVPTLVLTLGVIGLLAWAVVEAQASFFGIALFGFFILLKTLIKTVILVGLAIIVAPAAGLSFGGLWSAILKLAAIVVFADALLMWFEAILEHLGAIPSGTPTFGRRNGWWLIGLMKTLLTAAFIGIQLRFMFDMDSEEVGIIAVPMAFINRILDFLLWIGLGLLLQALLAPAVPAATPAAPPAGGSSAAASAAPAAPPPTREQTEAAEADAAIKQKLTHNRLTEGREWSSRLISDRQKRAARFIEELYAAGATRVWVDPLARNMLYIELPKDPAARKAVVMAARAVSPIPANDVGQRFLVVEGPATSRK